MYLPPLARLFDEGNSNGHLVRVVKCKPRHNSLQVHLLNSRALLDSVDPCRVRTGQGFLVPPGTAQVSWIAA